jgi:acyl-CoA thioester hydrolase
MRSHIEHLRVRWVDTDASGRIHYTAAFRYFEAAEWELFRQAGYPLKGNENDYGWPRVEVAAMFHIPLYVDDELAVHIRPERIGNTSITFVFEIFRTEARCASGKVTIVCVGNQGRPIPIPEHIRQALRADPLT